MAGKRIEVQLGINADVSAAKKSINDLQNALNNLHKVQSQRGFQDFGINKAVESAHALEISLNRALNVQTGKLDLSKFSSSLKEAGTSLHELNASLLSAGSAGQQVFLSLANSISQAEVPLKKTSRLVHDFSRTLKNTITYQISASMFNAVTGALSDAISYTKNLNSSLNDIRIVTGQSADQMAKFAASANASAQKLNTTTNAYAKASLIFYQQGLNDAEVKKRTDAVVKMSNVTKENMEDVSSYMTAIWNNFDDGSASLEHYADVMTALGAATASSTKEIAAGLEKFAAIGKTIGLSYEYATSAVATIVDKTRQSADTVGTGLRTIFSRLQGLSLGETLEDGVDLNKYSTALKTVGVNILDASGNMKDMDAILDSLAGKWKNLSNAQKTALAQTVGGVRQYTTLISLMDNWDSMEQNLNIASTSEGSLQKQQDIYAESWEAASKRSQAALEALYQTLLNDKGFIAIINGLTEVTNAVTYLVDALGGLPGVLGMVGMIGTKVFSKQITAGLESSLNKLMLWNSQFKDQGLGKIGVLKKIATGDTKSAAQIQAAEAAKKAMAEYKAQATNLENAKKQDSSAYYATQAAQELLTVKTNLLQVENELTETQKRNAQSQIDLMGKQQQALLELRQEKEQMAKDDKIQANKEIREVLNSMSYQQPDGYYRSDNEQVQEILGGSYKGSGNVNSLAKLREKSAKAQYDSEMAAFFMTNATPDANLKDLRLGINDIFGSGTISETAGLEEIKTKLKEISESAERAEKEVTDVMKAANGGDATQKALRNLQTSGQNVGSSRSSIDIERLERERSLRRTQEQFNRNIKPGQNDPEEKAKKTAKAMQTAAQTIASVTAGISQAKSAIETFGDAGASAGDQISAGMSLASGAVTAFLTGGPWAAVAYAVSVIGTIAVDAIIKKINEAELAAQKAEEVAQSLSSAAEEAANHLESIKSAVDGYDSAIETLNNCTKGTEEWNEALKNVHSEISQLLNDFPELLNKNNLFNSDGTLNQTVLDEAVTEAEMAAIATNGAAVQGQVAAKQARLKANTVSESKVYTKYYSTYDQWGNETYKAYNTGYKDFNDTATFAGDLEKIINSFSTYGSEALELKDVYDALGSEMGDNATITDAYANSLFNLAKQSVTATTMMDNAAKSIISDWSQQTGEDLIVGQSDLMSAAYNNAVQTYNDALKVASDQNNKAHNIDHSKLGAEFDNTSFAGMSITEAFNAARGTNYQLASNGVRGTDNNRTYVYLENGEEKIYKFEELQATIAAAAALEQMGESAAAAKEKLNGMSERLGDDKAATGIQNYIASKNLESMTQTDFENMSAAVKAEGGASAYLQKALNMTEEEIKTTLGETFITDFENAIDRTSIAWEDAWGNNKEIAQAALGDIVNSMSLSDTATLSNYIEKLSLGPAGEYAGVQFVEGLNKMIADIDPEKQQEAFSKLLTSVDWTSYDAFDQAQAILKEYGITISETDAKWQSFVSDMRIASGALPDFSRIKTDLNNISAIVKTLKFGEMISDEDYQTLIAYNDEWERFFLLQADGSRQFIGSQEDFTNFIQEKTIANREEINLRRDVSKLEGIGEVDWAAGGEEASEAFSKYWDNTQFKTLLENMGYTPESIALLTEEQITEMYRRIGKAINENQIDLDQFEFEQMIASMATSVDQLDGLLADGTIGQETYSRALIAMAGGYEYCTTAVKEYQKALASGKGVEEAQAQLEAQIEMAKQAEKYESAYQNAMRGKSSMSLEDLSTIQEANPELYAKFMTSTEAEWQASSYAAYSKWLDTRMAGYNKDSAEYAALIMQKQQLDQEYYSSLEDKASEAAEVQKKKWEEAISAAESAMSASSNFMSGDISFTNIEEFKQNMIDAGVETERVIELIEGLSNVGTNTEQIKTAMVAASEAALAKLGNLNEQQQEYTGLVTNLDVSKVEPGNIEMHGNLGNGEQVTDEVQDAIEAADTTITAEANTENVTSDIEYAVTEANGTKIITMSDGSTISGDITAAVFDANGNKIITMSDGSTLRGDINSAILNADGSKTITMSDDSTISGDIVSAITAADGSKIITYADESTLSGDITNAISNADGTKTITLTDGSTFTGAISQAVADATGTKVITYADNSTLSGDIASAVVNADGTKTIVMDGNNSTLSGDIVSAINATDGSIIVTMSDGSETSLPAEVVAALSGNGKVFDVNAYLANPESLQDTINNLNLTAEVDVKLNLAQQALDAMKSTLMTGLSPDELQEVMKYSSMSNDEILAALTEDNRSGWEKFWGTGQDSQIRWSLSDKAALTQMVSNMIDLSPDEIAAQMMDPNSLLNSLLKALNAAVESGDTKTADMAMFLLEGLGQGLSEGCSSFNWDACLTALGPEVSAAFKSALGIHSPSTLTQALAPYLFEGLAVGIAKCDASFTIPALPGVVGAVARAFSEAIKIGADGIDVSALNGIVDEDLLTDFTQRRQFMDEYSAVDETTGEAEWETIIGDQAWEAALDAEAARAEAEREAQLSTLDSSKPHAIAYEGEMMTPSEAGIQARADAAAAGVIDGKTREQIRREAIDNYMQEYMDVSSEIITDFSMDYFKNKKWLKDDTMSAIQTAAISGAVETAMKEMQITEGDLPNLTEEQQAQFVNLVQTNLNESGEKIAFEIDKTWAEIKDIWISGLDSIYQAETELAEKTFSLWESTFNAIAKARLGLMDDKSILESMFGDPNGVSDIIESYLNAGYRMEDILEMLKNPDARLNFTPFDLESYHKSGPQRFLNTDENGNYTVNTSLTDYNANVDKYVTEQLGPHLTDVIGNTLTQDQITQMKTSGNAEELAFIKFLENQGIIDASGDLLEGAQVLTDVLDKYAQSLYLDTQQEVNAVQADAVSTQQTEYYKRANTLQQEGEQLMSQKESDKSLLETARQMKLSGESLSTLTTEEQTRLLELTGASSLSAISLETLNTATIECANAMLTCAQQIAVAMGMIQSGQADSWTIDPKTGQVTVSKNITYGNSGGMDIDADTKARVDQVYSDSMANAGYTKTSEQWYRNGETVNTSTDTDWQAANASAITAMNSTVIGSKDIQLGEFNAETDGARIKGTDLEAGLGAVTDADVAILKDYADALGMTTDEFDDYAESLYENAETGKEWVDLTEEEKREAREFAVQAGRISNAWVDLTENQENNIKTLKKGQKGTIEYRKALGSLQKDIKTIFGDAEEVTSNFVEEHLKDIEKMAKGDKEAAERIEKALLEDMMGDELFNEEIPINFDVDQDGVTDQLTTVGTLLNNFGDQYADKEIGFTVTADDEPAIAALNQLLASGAMTADQMNDLLATIGWAPEITYQTADGKSSFSGEQIQTMIGNGTATTVVGTSNFEIGGQIYIPVIGSVKKTGGGASSIPSGGRRGGGGGGGGGREARRANKINKEDNIERYHEIDNIIDDLADAYERLNKEEDRAWGKNRINAMQQESKILKEQIAAVEEKIRQAKQWKEQDLSAALSAGWTFDANGNVNNYDEFLSSQIDKYNAAIDSYNNMSAGAQEDLDKKYSDMTNKDGEYYSGYEDYLKQTLIDGPKEALEQYEETMELLEDLGMEYDDFLNEWHDNIIGQIQTKLDTTLEITEAQLGYLEHKLSRIEDDAYSAAEAIGLMGQQMDIAQAQFNAQKSALDNLLKAYGPEGIVWSAEDLMNGNISAEDLANAGMQSGDIELIQTIMEGLMDASEQMSEQMVNSIEHMANAFEEFNTDMDRYISTVEHAQAITSTYRNIIDLTGRTMSGFNSTMLKSINDAIAAQSVAKLETNKTKYETIKTEYDEAKAAYEAAQASYAEGGIDATALKAAKDTYQAAQDNMNEAQETFLSSWEEALQAAADAFQSNMEAAVRDIGEMMSGGLAGGLAELEDAFAKMNEQDQNYVDDYEKIYQLTKMTRDLNDKIDNTSNVRAQKELLKYQKELNGLLESDQKMSSYDLDYLQKKLDLKLAEIALDEAQNAKSQVTMRRDSEGNYNYVYTADENAVEKAESEYADKLYEMQKANDEYITSLSENMANLSSQMLNEIAAIDTTIYDTEEKYQAEVQRITDHYTTQMEYYNSEMNKVLDNNKILYEQDWTNFSKYTGYKISAEENYVTRWNQTVLSQVTGFETQEEFYENFNKAVFGEDPAHPSGESLIGRLVTAYKSMRDQITAANAAAGVETEDLATALLGNIEAATQEAEAAANDITDAATEIVSQITSIGDAVTDMVNNYSQAMATMEAQTDAMLGVLLDFLTAYGEIGNLNIEPGVLAEIEARRRERQENPEGFDTGGYTGAWGSEGRLAYLHQKELVLNAEDTVNMLTSVGILRQIASIIDLNALASAGGFISLMSSGVGGNQGTLQQEVHIEASFPAVTDKNQIEEAFGDLVNLAAQYANRRV